MQLYRYSAEEKICSEGARKAAAVAIGEVDARVAPTRQRTDLLAKITERNMQRRRAKFSRSLSLSNEEAGLIRTREHSTG